MTVNRFKKIKSKIRSIDQEDFDECVKRMCACFKAYVCVFQSFRKSEPFFSIFLKCKRSVEGTVKLHKGKADGDKALLEFPKPVTGFTTRLLRKEETIQSFTGCPPCLLSRTFSLSLSPPPLLLLPSHCTSYATLKSRFSLFLSPPNCLALSLSLSSSFDFTSRRLSSSFFLAR